MYRDVIVSLTLNFDFKNLVALPLLFFSVSNTFISTMRILLAVAVA
jgi:hypothetical protein